MGYETGRGGADHRECCHSGCGRDRCGVRRGRERLLAHLLELAEVGNVNQQ
jgi:hypothetical protein